MRWAAALLLSLLPNGLATAALAQATGVNPPVGWVWTYLGATYGAGWASPLAGTFVVSPPPPPADAAPTIQNAIQSNSHIIVVPGSYSLCSTQASGYANTGPMAIVIRQKSNFVLDLWGVTLTVCNAATTGNTGTGHFEFDQDTNFRVNGGIGVGNMTGKTGGDTVFISQNNNRNAVFDGQDVTQGDWQSLGGVAFDGFWDDHVIIQNLNAKNVSKCFDFGFMSNLTIRNATCSGQYQGGIGVWGFGNFYDTTSTGYNYNSLPITDTHNVELDGNTFTNYASGWSISSGGGYKLSNNHLVANVGGASTQGWGGVVAYNNGGVNTSVGHPPHDIQSVNDVYESNGNATTGGGGIFVQNNTITNSDVISGLRIASRFITNTDRGVGLGGSANIADISLSGSTCANNTVYCLDPSAAAVDNPVSTIASNAPVSVTNAAAIVLTSLTVASGQWTFAGSLGLAPGAGTTVSRATAFITGACSPLQQPLNYGAPGIINLYNPSASNPAIPQYPIAPITVTVPTPNTPNNQICLGAVVSFTGGTAAVYGSLAATRAY